MAVQKKAKAPEPAGESAPMWIVSFADLVTLLMSFFVVLYAMKQGGPEQQMETSAAIKAAFDPNYMPDADSDPAWYMAIRKAHGMPGPPMQYSGKTPKQAQGSQGSSVEVQTIRAGKNIVTGGKILFASGETKVSDDALDTITQLANLLRGHNNVVMVKGHVSADELALRPDDANGFALSYQRANAVIDELAKQGIDRQVMRPVACGSFEPIKVGAYARADQAENGRVEVFTTDSTASEFMQVPTVAPAASSAEQPASNP